MGFPHSGIRIDRIPAEEGGGLIFAVGTALIFMLAFPALLPVAGLTLAGGAALAPVVHWRRSRTLRVGNILVPPPSLSSRP